LFFRFAGHETMTVRFPAPGKTDLVRVYNYALSGQNIIFKVLQELRERGFPDTPLEIDLYKSVPPGTGLGSGSGNAAALIGWARRFVFPGILEGMESLIGADVPFLCKPISFARVRGIGDSIEPVAAHLPVCGCVMIPKWRCSTSEAYKALDNELRGQWLTEKQVAVETERVLSGLAAGKRVGLLPNDFIPGLVKIHPEYVTLFGLLEESGALAWGLSGSGSALFALYAKEDRDAKAGKYLSKSPGIERILFWE
jgi:4-diphosphocytidyl-2-C-methyl-D-erythritol kinase